MSANELDRLPQTGPARFVTRILRADGQAHCLARVPAQSPFRIPGVSGAGDQVPSLLAIEMAAQTAAALEPAAQDVPGSAGSHGSRRYLVGVRAVELHVEFLAADLEYVCRATLATDAPPLRIYRFEVSTPAGECVAQGELSTFAE